MVANPARRAQLADAAIAVLGADGARALTHRVIDQRAELPRGTASNYFPTRNALFLGAAERVFTLLAPDPNRLDRLAKNGRGEDAFVAYVEYILERLRGAPELSLALVELRLEATRSPAVADVIGPFLRAGFEADVQFHRGVGLPGGANDIAILHYLIDGVLLDQLTVAIDPRRDVSTDIRRFIHALLGSTSR